MERAVIYARFSSNMQNESSIDAQVRACKEYAEAKGYEIQTVYTDEAISGKSTLNRASYQRMMRAAKQDKFDVILIHKYDRIARNLGDHINLQNKLNELNIRLIAVAQDFGTSKEGKLMTGIQWILTEYYIDNLSEETRKGLKETALKGLHNGGVAPFGYDVVDKRYVINPVESIYVQKMFECCKNHTGYKELIEEMKENGVVGKRGKPITYNSIYEILKNEKYTGTYIYCLVEDKDRTKRRDKPNAIRIENALPQIVSKELFSEVQKIMQSRETKGRGNYINSGLVVCGKCGAKMHVAKANDKGHPYDLYYCSKHCGQGTIRVELLDKMVDKYLDTLLAPSVIKEVTDAMNRYTGHKEIMLADFENTRAEKLKEVEDKINNLTENMTKGSLPESVINIISDKLIELDKEKEKIKKIKPILNHTENSVEKWLDHILKNDRENNRRFVIDRVVVEDNTVTVVSTLEEIIEFSKKMDNKKTNDSQNESLVECGCGGMTTSKPTTFSLIDAIPIIFYMKEYSYE